MALQLADAIAEQADIPHQMSDFVAYLVGRFTHARVFLDLPDDVDGDHQQRRRDDDNLGAERFLHDVVKAVMQIGIHRFRGHEHERQLLGLARNQVFPGNVADMLADVGAQALRRGLTLVLGLGLAISGDGFERKLGIDHQRTLVWQEHAAVGTATVR